MENASKSQESITGGTGSKGTESARKNIDGWDKVDKIGRLIGALVTALALIVVSVVGNKVNTAISNAQEQSADIERQMNREMARIEMRMNRETAVDAMRSDIFGLLAQYVVSDLKKDTKRVVLLAALHGNFGEFFDSRPVFEAFARDFTDSLARRELRRLSQRVARRQAEYMQAHGGVNTELIFDWPNDRIKHLDDLAGMHAMDIEIEEVMEGPCGPADVGTRLAVSVDMRCEEDVRKLQFSLSFFDSPYMDNIFVRHMGEVHRISLLLLDIEEVNNNGSYRIRLEVLHFPDDLILPTDLPSASKVLSMSDSVSVHSH